MMEKSANHIIVYNRWEIVVYHSHSSVGYNNIICYVMVVCMFDIFQM